MDLSVATLTLETFLLVVIRVACFVAIAPIFGHKSINSRLRVLIAICISFTVFSAMDFEMPEYSSVFDLSFIMLREAAVGLSLGFVSSLVMAIIILVGEFIDREIGFSMAQSFDMGLGAMVTITAELYDKLIYLIILITNLHFYIIKAIAQSFELIPLGKISVDFPYMYVRVLAFISEYFSIGFRIAMPIFVAATILNVILGVMAKSSPQMNMFAVGMQLKVLIGLFVLSVMIMFVPNIANYLMEKMGSMLTGLLGGL